MIDFRLDFYSKSPVGKVNKDYREKSSTIRRESNVWRQKEQFN
jgi:hypothetical protein